MGIAYYNMWDYRDYQDAYEVEKSTDKPEKVVDA